MESERNYLEIFNHIHRREQALTQQSVARKKRIGELEVQLLKVRGDLVLAKSELALEKDRCGAMDSAVEDTKRQL